MTTYVEDLQNKKDIENKFLREIDSIRESIDLLEKIQKTQRRYLGLNKDYKVEDLKLGEDFKKYLNEDYLLENIKSLVGEFHKAQELFEANRLNHKDNNILYYSKSHQLQNDTYLILDTIVKNLMSKWYTNIVTGSYINPSNFKNKICNIDSNIETYTFYKIAQGFQKKIDKQITMYIENRSAYIHILDMRTNVRLTYILGDMEIEAQVKVAMWVKGTDNFVDAGKIPPIPRDTFVEYITNNFTH